MRIIIDAEYSIVPQMCHKKGHKQVRKYFIEMFLKILNAGMAVVNKVRAYKNGFHYSYIAPCIVTHNHP